MNVLDDGSDSPTLAGSACSSLERCQPVCDPASVPGEARPGSASGGEEVFS